MPYCKASSFPRTASYGGLYVDNTRNRVLCILLLFFSKHQSKSTYPSTCCSYLASIGFPASLSIGRIGSPRTLVTSLCEMILRSEFESAESMAALHTWVVEERISILAVRRVLLCYGKLITEYISRRSNGPFFLVEVD